MPPWTPPVIWWPSGTAAGASGVPERWRWRRCNSLPAGDFSFILLLFFVLYFWPRRPILTLENTLESGQSASSTTAYQRRVPFTSWCFTPSSASTTAGSSSTTKDTPIHGHHLMITCDQRGHVYCFHLGECRCADDDLSRCISHAVYRMLYMSFVDTGWCTALASVGRPW